MTISVSQFFIDPTSSEGLQTQLKERIVSAILRRRFPPNARMPASRKLASHLGVARITVALAYQDLISDGYLVSRPRSGVFVATDPPELMARDRPNHAASIDWSARLGPLLADARRVHKPANWRSYPYPFVYGQVDNALFPHDSWRTCARQALGKREFHEVSADAGSRDDARLVAYTLSHSLPTRGIEARDDELLITLGAQNGMWLAIESLRRGRPSYRVAVEDPCYPELREILRCSGVQVEPVPVDEHGMILDHLPNGCDLVCVAPSHQAPTGASLSRDRRRELLKRAERDDFLILEDDYDFEMSFLRPPSPALKAYDAEGRVIYIGSYSKPLFPGLRLGYMVAPAPLIHAARTLRSASIRHPPGMTQRTAAHFLALGHYNAHVDRMKRVFAKRRSLMEHALAKTGFKAQNDGGHGGASLWVATPNGSDSQVLAEHARSLGVLIEAGVDFFLDPQPTPLFRIAYSSITEDRIEAGVNLLAEAVDMTETPGLTARL